MFKDCRKWLHTGMLLVLTVLVLAGMLSGCGMGIQTVEAAQSTLAIQANFGQNAAGQRSPSGTLTAVGRIGDSIDYRLTASGGSNPYQWALSSGSLPTGLSLGSDGRISGLLSTMGSWTAKIQVADSSTPQRIQIQALTFNVVAPLLAISTPSMDGGQTGTFDSINLQAAGGTPAYAWSVTSGSLPAGLTLSSAGMVSGTFVKAGTFTFAVSVSDAGNPVQQASQTFSITVTEAPLQITSSAPSKARVGQTYNTKLAAAGGTPGYSWSVTSGTLPNGLSLSAGGILSGTPTVAGGSSFTVGVTDASSPTQTTTQPMVITILPAVLSVRTPTLNSGRINTAYAATLAANGGTSPYTWSVKSGTLPAGLSLSNTGTINGTPTATGTSSFTVEVTDNGSTSMQSATKSFSLTIAAVPLLTTGAVANGQSTVAYATQLSATGGTPAYTWSITSGSLPSGLTLGATTGIIQGTPTTSGNFTFTYKVTDNGSPQQSASASATIKVAAAPVQSGSTAWYIRPDGGTRYDTASNPYGQCDGKSDSAYGGVGTNQHCAFNDYRLLWDNHEYHNRHWVIAGGDTVILAQKAGGWRVGFDGVNPNDNWCIGDDGNTGCTNPTVPAGTASQHTRILGENYGSCGTKSAMTQVFGGHGVGTPFNLTGAKYVDVQCIEITDHSNCVTHGSPALPRSCDKDYGSLDDFDSDGIVTDTGTHDLLLKNLWIHGHTDRGIIGAVGGLITADTIDIDKNVMAGWDFDPGNSTASVNSTLLFKNSIIEWSGCNEQYPLTSAVPVTSCYSQSTGGYGDGIGTPAGMGMNVTLDHSIFRYNTQDGEDFGHIDSPMQNGTYGRLTITNSQSYGNSGQQFKWGPGFMNITFTGNVAEANCRRLAEPFPGAPSDYNANLSDFCRAFDAMSFNFINGSNALFSHNTLITYAPTTLDMKCEDGNGCANTVFTLSDNLFLAYSNPAYQYNGWNKPAVYCGAYCNETTLPIGTMNRDNNLYYNFRSCPAGAAAASSQGVISGEFCSDPLLTNEPLSFTNEASLDNIAATLTSGSPARGMGVGVSSLLKDLLGNPWNSPPSIGALEYGASATYKLSTAQ